MKTIKLLVPVLILLVLSAACRKNIPGSDTDKSIKNMKVPAGFDWSVSTTYNLSVDIIGNGEGKPLMLFDLGGNIIAARTILGNQATFSFQLPDAVDTVRVYSPDSRLGKYIRTGVTQTDFVMYGEVKAPSSRGGDFALNLNGSSNYIQLNNGLAGSMLLQYPFTLSAWFKTTGGGAENSDMVLVNIADPNVATAYYGIYLRKFAENFYKAEVKSKNGSTEYVKSTNQNVSDNTWHQVVGIFTADGKRKLYLDGIYEGMSSSVLGFNPNVTAMVFGRWGDKTPDKYFNGLLDNICIWTRELSDQEVMNYYQQAPVGNESGLAGYYQFNQGSGAAASNSVSGGAYPGIIYGAGWVDITLYPDTDGDGVTDDSDFWPLDPSRAYNEVCPPGNNYYFNLFEDLWPGTGDYDFNDVVLKTKINLYRNSLNNLVGGRVTGNVYWIGGGIPRGLGMEWFKSNADATQLTYLPANAVTFTQPQSVMKDPQVPDAVLLFNNVLVESLNQTVDFEFTWDQSVGGNNPGIQVYIYRNRNHEIHRFGYPPTQAANMALFGTDYDASQTTWDWTAGRSFPNPSAFYKTSTHLPWGIEIVAPEFWIPNEKTEIIAAYPQFRSWAESGGTLNKSWYHFPDQTKSHLPAIKQPH